MTDVSLAKRIGAGADDEPALLARRYEILEVVAEGGQGELVRAWDHHHNRPVALKIRAAGPGVDLDRLLAEARALLNVRPHPNMAFVRDDFFDADKHYLVLDWVSGEDLRTRLRREGRPGLPFDLVADIASDIASVLDHLHGHQPPVVHGDVKPANIVLADQEDRPRAVLVDFGNCAPATELSAVTLEYAAPEVLAGDPPTPASDVYALAATTFELLTGRVAIPGATLDWSAVPTEQVPHVRDALISGLATRPEQRSTSAADFVERLTTGRTPQSRTQAKRARQRRVRTLAAVAVALVIGVVAGGVTIAATSSDSPASRKSFTEGQLLSGDLPAGVSETGRLGIYQTWGYFNTYAIGDDGSGALVYHQENMAHEWPIIQPVIDDQVLFYQPGDGGAAIVEWHQYGTLLNLYDVPAIGKHWTYVRRLAAGTLYMYNPRTGADQLVRFRNKSDTPRVIALPAAAPGWTTLAHVTDTQLLSYDRRTGRAQLTTFDGTDVARTRPIDGLPAGLEALDGLGDGRIAYGDAADGVLHIAAITDARVGDQFTVDVGDIGWRQEIPIADDRVILYAGSTGQSVLVTVDGEHASVGPPLGLLRAAKVLVGRW